MAEDIYEQIARAEQGAHAPKLELARAEARFATDYPTINLAPFCPHCGDAVVWDDAHVRSLGGLATLVCDPDRRRRFVDLQRLRGMKMPELAAPSPARTDDWTW